MNLPSSEILTTVFKRVPKESMGEFSLDAHMLEILMELDGKKRPDAIAKKTGMKIGTLRDVLTRLLKLKLIEPVTDTIPVLDKDFLDYLISELAIAIGPIAEILVEDAMSDLGHNAMRFPSHRAAELVDLLARQIEREEKRKEFKHNLVTKLKERKY